jgi:hypothetical protein
VTISGNFAGTAFSATLDRRGGTYRGSTQAPISTCGDKRDTNTLSFTIVVLDGDVHDDVQWIASRWRGSLRLEYPYTDLGRTLLPRDRRRLLARVPVLGALNRRLAP